MKLTDAEEYHMHYESFTLKDGFLRLSDYVKIREEYFGGIVFHTDTGDAIEVDYEAYKLLVWIRETSAADIRILSRQKQTRDILPLLLGISNGLVYTF